MKNFGKLTAAKIQFPNLDGDGNTVNYTEVMGFFDENGVEWHALYQTDPYGAYIAVDDNSCIVSAQTDYEQVQIAGFTIWGLDDFYEHTFAGPNGSGASCLGWYWTEDDIVEVSLDVELVSLTSNQFRTMLEVLDKKQAFETNIENLTPLVKKIMSRNVYNNPTTTFFYATEVVALTAPLVWGEHWKTIIKTAWYEAKGY